MQPRAVGGPPETASPRPRPARAVRSGAAESPGSVEAVAGADGALVGVVLA